MGLRLLPSNRDPSNRTSHLSRPIWRSHSFVLGHFQRNVGATARCNTRAKLSRCGGGDVRRGPCVQVRNSYCTGIAEDDESQMKDMEQRIEAAEVGPHA